VADFSALKQYHYRADRPATAMRVLAIRRASHTAASRFLGIEPEQQTVAVLVESLPSLSCKMRNEVLGDRYGNWLSPGQRAKLVNSEVRVISRVVVHPCWRGLGLAVRLVRSALESSTTPYTEALAAMGRVNPFLARAGMAAYPRPPHRYDTRLADVLRVIGLQTCDLACLDRVSQHIESLKPKQRAWIHKELARWYRQNGGRSATHSRDPKVHLAAVRSRLMLTPVYYLHYNPKPITDKPEV